MNSEIKGFRKVVGVHVNQWQFQTAPAMSSILQDR